jgi:FixJ family two-component response regulator
LEQGPLIAIIDDDESVRSSVSGLVRSLGYSARTFASAAEFLGSGAQPDSACIISDVQMPGISGIELKEALMAAGSRTPVILMTAFVSDAVMARASQAGAVCFLRKPFDAEELIRCLDAAIPE